MKRIRVLIESDCLGETAIAKLNLMQSSLTNKGELSRKEQEYFESNITAYEMLLQFL